MAVNAPPLPLLLTISWMCSCSHMQCFSIHMLLRLLVGLMRPKCSQAWLPLSILLLSAHAIAVQASPSMRCCATSMPASSTSCRHSCACGLQNPSAALQQTWGQPGKAAPPSWQTCLAPVPLSQRQLASWSVGRLYTLVPHLATSAAMLSQTSLRPFKVRT